MEGFGSDLMNLLSTENTQQEAPSTSGTVRSTLNRLFGRSSNARSHQTQPYCRPSCTRTQKHPKEKTFTKIQITKQQAKRQNRHSNGLFCDCCCTIHMPIIKMSDIRTAKQTGCWQVTMPNGKWYFL
ncbi:uncharacterized protein LOC143459547 [Clavelina lepadiformis]|uniref:uncharacterized protein LOC143459547 n=1 Tax=Clavelina lepadiformis TaxID=159417 RepID=UPI0040414D4B